MIESIKMNKPKTPEEIEEFYQEGIEDLKSQSIDMYDLIDQFRGMLKDLDNVEDFTYSEVELGDPSLVISTGDDVSGFKWTQEDEDKLREVIIKINQERIL